jgi:cytochrome c biogenesis protein CcmG/thiol:disulfide interchange protein DsbE
MMTRSKLAGFLILIALVVLLLSGCGNSNVAAGSRPTTAKIGDLAPEIDLKSVTGDQITLSKLEGRPVLINFWATWCGPCRQEFPALVRMYKKYQGKGLVVLGVNYQDPNPDTGVLTFMKDTLVNFPVVRDTGDRVGQQYRVDGLPTSYFVDRKGIVRDVVVGGPMTDEFLDKEFAKIDQ